MPVCNVIVAEESRLKLSDDQLVSIRSIVARALDSSARRLNHEHIVVRVHAGRRNHMLADVELEAVGQFFLRRYLTRDSRAELMSKEVGDLLGVNVATWIHLVGMGYARVTTSGERFFSD